MPPQASKVPAIIDFPPFQLDLRAGLLRLGTTPVPLRPKTFAVLQNLAQRPGELISKQALLDAVWGDVAVSEDVVRLSVGELRAALRDERAAPRFIETVSRRGYRFIAQLGARGTMTFPSAAGLAIDGAPVAESTVGTTVVGRTRERAEIADWLRAAMSGRRQIGFVTGEAGIGKTTLVDTALRDLRQTSAAHFRIARGQCVEHYGGGEPYLPLLEALASLGRGPDGSLVEASLRDRAPEWVLREIGFPEIREDIRAEPAGPHDHTLHRLAASLDTLAADTPLVLVLEDVHWSDFSTLDLLSVLARRREPARLLVLCTLRLVDAIVRGHPVATVKRELFRQGLCREILLGGLSAEDVASYLSARFVGVELPVDILPLLIDRSEGNPFFLVTLVDHLLEEQHLLDTGNGWELRQDLETLRTVIPDGLRAVIEPRLDRLTLDELRVLEAASVAGLEFAAHAVAAVAPQGSDATEVERVERVCDALARRQEILCSTGDSAWPDGTTSACYAFRHALYQQVIYQRLSPTTRRRLHQTLGEALEAAHTNSAREVASELAAHFERSRDVERAVRYHGEAADHARTRSAYGESRLHLEAALDLVRGQPETTDGLRRQMPLLEHLGWTSFALKGWGDSDAAHTFSQMRGLAERLDGAVARFQAMEGQLIVHTMRAEYTAARAQGEEMLLLAEQLGNRWAVANALPPLGATLIHLGEIEAAHELAARGRALCDPEAPTIQGISSHMLLASTSVHLGLVAQAREVNGETMALAAKVAIPYIRAHAANFAATTCQLLRDVAGTRSLADNALHLATEYGFSVTRATATMYRGWCDVQDGRVDDGLTAVRAGFAEYMSTGQRISTTSYSVLLAEVHLASGDVASANEVLDSALAFAAETGERLYEHELYRLKGECLVASGPSRSEKAEAIEHFERAISIAAAQKALLFELRAAVSLCRVQKGAREWLARLVDRFGATGDCADLRAAQALLGAR